ncbi:MAG: sulfatase-like hydrolase/transferase [Chloroflexota bacterium]
METHNEPPTNILFILCDQLRADALGAFGNPIIQTPYIDRLSQCGVTFTQCMVTQPTCTPSRASILSGCYPSALRTRMVGCQTPDDPRLLPRILGENGYLTASIGKIHLAPQGEEPALIEANRQPDGAYDYYGFQEIDLVNGHGDRCFGPQYTRERDRLAPDAAQRLKQRRRYPHGTDDTYIFPLPETIHSSNYVGDRTVKFLREVGEKPFFLHVSFPDPHQPFCVPAPYDQLYQPEEMSPPIPPLANPESRPPWYWEAHNGQGSPNVDRPATASSTGLVDRVTGTKPLNYSRYSVADYQQMKAIYYGMITLMDYNIGRILNTLDEEGLADNTIVVFVSDHGEYLGDYGLIGKGMHFDSAIRVPLIFAGPKIVQERRVNDIASTLDIAPTLLDMVGAREPEGVQGISMREVLSGSKSNVRQAALTENDDDFVPMKARTLTTLQWKLSYYAGHEFGELYNRQADPQELTNLWSEAEYTFVKRELNELLMEEILCTLDVSNGRRQEPKPKATKWTPRYL